MGSVLWWVLRNQKFLREMTSLLPFQLAGKKWVYHLSSKQRSTDNEQNFGQSDPKLNQSIGSAQIKWSQFLFYYYFRCLGLKDKWFLPFKLSPIWFKILSNSHGPTNKPNIDQDLWGLKNPQWIGCKSLCVQKQHTQWIIQLHSKIPKQNTKIHLNSRAKIP